MKDSDQKWDFISSKKESYTKRQKIAAGDYYGIGERAKTGKIKSSYISPSSSDSEKSVGKAPKKIV